MGERYAVRKALHETAFEIVKIFSLATAFVAAMCLAILLCEYLFPQAPELGLLTLMGLGGFAWAVVSIFGDHLRKARESAAPRGESDG